MQPVSTWEILPTPHPHPRLQKQQRRHPNAYQDCLVNFNLDLLTLKSVSRPPRILELPAVYMFCVPPGNPMQHKYSRQCLNMNTREG